MKILFSLLNNAFRIMLVPAFIMLCMAYSIVGYAMFYTPAHSGMLSMADVFSALAQQQYLVLVLPVLFMAAAYIFYRLSTRRSIMVCLGIVAVLSMTALCFGTMSQSMIEVTFTGFVVGWIIFSIVKLKLTNTRKLSTVSPAL